MTGGAVAAKKYLITSTKQISPAVLKKLKGKPGPAGPAGLAGPAGKAGANGVNGTNGTNGLDGETGFTQSLPPGETLTGVWSNAFFQVAGEPVTSVQLVPISFSFPVSTALTPSDVHYIKKEEETGEGDCPGSIEEPEAVPGKLCIYTETEEVAPGGSITLAGIDIPKPGTTGVVLKFTETGIAILEGNWALTAPTS
jgi:hypothetical protein